MTWFSYWNKYDSRHCTRFRYNWSDPIIAHFNQRLDRSQGPESRPHIFKSAVNNTFIKCYYKEKRMDCVELFRPVITDAGNILSYLVQVGRWRRLFKWSTVERNFLFCHSPVDFHAYSCDYPCLLPLTAAYSSSCWCTNIDGSMTKAKFLCMDNIRVLPCSNIFVILLVLCFWFSLNYI